MGSELLRGKKHGSLDPMRIGKALFVFPGTVAKLVPVLQYYPGFLLLFLHPVEILPVLPGSSFKQPDMCQNGQNQKARKQDEKQLR